MTTGFVRVAANTEEAAPREGLPCALGRRDLPSSTIRILQRGGWRKPDVRLVVLSDGRHAVVKDYRGGGRRWREALGRWLCAREARAYRMLAGLPAVPALLGRLDASAIVLEYRPGSQMSRRLAGQLPGRFIDEVRAAVRDMHRRGVVHLDLRHRSNLLADGEGRPVMIDFGSALFLKPGGLSMGILSRFDWSAVDKWEARTKTEAAANASNRSGDRAPSSGA